jgi:cation transport regulator ChaC
MHPRRTFKKIMTWIFGYGSLIWKTDFPYEIRKVGYIDGFVRRFWQHSIDHRGTESEPGLVVTLIPKSEYENKFKMHDPHSQNSYTCWGVLYKIRPEDQEAVFDYLDFREKNGYECHNVQATLEDGNVVECKLYIASSENVSFYGPQPIEHLTEIIAHRRGPSGPNAEYLLNLEKSHREICNSDDEHLQQLAALVRSKLNNLSNKGTE